MKGKRRKRRISLSRLPTAILEKIAECITLENGARRRIGGLRISCKMAVEAIRILFARDAEDKYPYTQ